MTSCGYAVPDYRVYEFRDGFYKLVKFKNADRTVVSLNDHSEDTHYDSKLDASYSRARSVVLQLALCNEWEYFFTGTVDGKLRDRTDLFSFTHGLTQWIRDYRKKGIPLKFFFVFERHADLQAWHIHGMLSGLPESELGYFVRGQHPDYLVANGYRNWPAYAKSFGYCSLGRIKDPIAAGFYITKYVSKELADRGNSGVRCHLYTCARGLKRAQSFGDIYGQYSNLDNLLTYDYDFCRTGFVQCSWSEWLNYIDTGPEDFGVIEPVQETPDCPEWEQMIFYGFGRGGYPWRNPLIE